MVAARWNVSRGDPIDVVVTDLEMPEVNGLQLVEAMRADYPHVPAILITSRGSEELASQALRQGAASYVPKSHLKAMLADTIANVMGVMAGRRQLRQVDPNPQAEHV